METILLALTVVSMLMALVMSAVAWRLSRQERARAAARIAALAAAAADDTPLPPAVTAAAVTPVQAPPALVTPPPPLAASSRIALFPDARGAAAAAAAADFALNDSAHNEDLSLRPSVAPLAESFLSSAGERQAGASRQRGLLLAAALLLVALGSGAYWVLSDTRATAQAAAATPANSNAPLELISLRHERRGSKLTLSGLVRNPAGGAPVEGLTAVVFLFDAQGGFVSSARAGVDFTRLAPGDESPFVIAVNAPASVARYRVSFRTGAGIVAHVDRRGEAPVGTSAARM